VQNRAGAPELLPHYRQIRQLHDSERRNFAQIDGCQHRLGRNAPSNQREKALVPCHKMAPWILPVPPGFAASLPESGGKFCLKPKQGHHIKPEQKE
jgi:hypothetical protein